jgi:hypothetical protein
MAGVFQKLLLVAMAGCVLLVFIAPSVDLPDSVLRASHGLDYLLLYATVPASVIISGAGLIFRREGATPLRFTPCLFPWLCVFLC